jgi:hypothetical protein
VLLPVVESWGEVRLRIAQFLANLWQGPCVVVHGTSADASLPAALDRAHSRWSRTTRA